MKRWIVAGCRSYTDEVAISQWIGYFHQREGMDEIVHGGCRGVDEIAGNVAARLHIPIKVFPADWDTHGKAAGPIRNRQMAEYASHLLAFWDYTSKGTMNMINEMLAQHKFVVVVNISDPYAVPQTYNCTNPHATF